ncbi:MAG TPA: YihY/virulence factor BrkB family protein [Ilumatobacteraceae bacterium]
MLGRLDLWQQEHRIAAFPIAVFRKFSDDRAGRLAALIAYYGFFSVFPAMLALVTILGFVLENHPAERTSIAHSALAQFPIIGDSIASSVSHPLTGNVLALVIGLGGAAWAALGAMQAAQDAMNEVWDVRRSEYPGFIAKRVRSLLMMLLLIVLIVTTTTVSQLAAVVVSGVAATGGLAIASVIVSSGAFLIAFRVLTVKQVTWREVAPGAVTAGVFYTALQIAGGAYVTRTLNGAQSTYGTFATVIGLLSWLFLIAQVTLLAAEVNVVATKAMWPRSLFTAPATAADKRSATAQADKETIDATENVDVDFSGDVRGSDDGDRHART